MYRWELSQFTFILSFGRIPWPLEQFQDWFCQDRALDRHLGLPALRFD
jgi:hypothetical protein